jgi:hypothetical protein
MSQNLDIAQAFARLVSQQRDLDQDLLRSSQTHGSFVEYQEEEIPTDSASPVVDAFIADLGLDAFKGMTNFTHQGFSTLGQALLPAWTLGRGRRHEVSAMDALFSALVVLKHYDTWSKHGVDPRFQTPTFEKMVTKMCCIEGLFGDSLSHRVYSDVNRCGMSLNNTILTSSCRA